jgi:predicted  nucleic acid-binding Zn-ribbon protein
MSELLLQEILHEVKGMRGDIQIFNNRIGNIEERMINIEKRMSKVEGRISVMEEKIAIIEENLKETKSICEAVRHGQDVLNAKYDALSLDVHEMKRKIVHITNTLEMKVLPSLKIEAINFSKTRNSLSHSSSFPRKSGEHLLSVTRRTMPLYENRFLSPICEQRIKVCCHSLSNVFFHR